MSIESVAQALKPRSLTATQKLVLIGIANHDGDGGAWPSMTTLAGYAECSERGDRASSRLCALFPIAIVRSTASGSSQRGT